MIERERKFLLKDDSVLNGVEPLMIEQGYLMLKKGKQLRVRIINNWVAFLCYKSKIDKQSRDEFEYKIPTSDARKLFDSCKHKLQKLRFEVKYKGIFCEIDVYPDGLKVVEIEFLDELPLIPDFCGEEITDNNKYSNIRIAKRNSQVI